MQNNITDKTKQHPGLFQNFLTITQSGLIFILIVLVIFMMSNINRLQGTARVINYAGLVRGATQRLVKLEMAKAPNDELIEYLDDILYGLKYDDRGYDFVILDSDEYQNNLDCLILYWEDLKKQIEKTRSMDYVQTELDELLELSELYFTFADNTVSSAESYSEKIAKRILIIEFFTATDMLFLTALLVKQTLSAIFMRKKNAALSTKAYIDTLTGLQNKNVCQDMLNDDTIITRPTACLVFDLNNLKQTNDTLGHLAGDKVIANFAKNLKKTADENDFVGRYGGDEFMLIIYDIDASSVDYHLKRLREEIFDFNSIRDNIPISYAEGWAVSTEHPDCTFKQLFSHADHCMYENKQKMKKEQR